MAMLDITFDSLTAIYMPDIMDVCRGIFENLPYNHIDYGYVRRKVIRQVYFEGKILQYSFNYKGNRCNEESGWKTTMTRLQFKPTGQAPS